MSGFGPTLAFTLGCCGLFSCGSPGTAEEVADRFVDDYFVRADQEAALQWSTGRAKRTLERELDLVRSVRAEGHSAEQAHPPTYVTRGRVRREGQRVVVQYEVVIETGAAMKRNVEVETQKTRQGWRVSLFRVRDSEGTGSAPARRGRLS